MILLSMKYEIHILLQNHNSYLKKTNEPHGEFTIEFLRNFGIDLMILHWGIFDIFWLFCFVYFFLLVVFFSCGFLTSYLARRFIYEKAGQLFCDAFTKQ